MTQARDAALSLAPFDADSHRQVGCRDKARFPGRTRRLVIVCFTVLVQATFGAEFVSPGQAKMQPQLLEKLRTHGSPAIQSAEDDVTPLLRVVVSLDPGAAASSLSTHSARLDDLQNQAFKALSAGDPDARLVGRIHRYQHLYGFSATLRPPEIAALAASPAVAYLELMPIHTKADAESHPLTGVDLAHSRSTGAGAVIAIIDDGIDHDHATFGGHTNFPNEKIIGGYDFADYDNDPSIDCFSQSHGTAVTAIAAGQGGGVIGVAPDARIIFLKVQSAAQCGSPILDGDVIGAIDWIIANKDRYGIDIVSMSFGADAFPSASVCEGASPLYTRAAQEAAAAGLTLFAATGNQGLCDELALPSCLSDVVSVGATYDANLGEQQWCVAFRSCADIYFAPGCPSNFAAAEIAYVDNVTIPSNSAPFMDILAPASCALTAQVGGGTNGCFEGTSAAAPFAAGAAALAVDVAGPQGLSPAALRNLMIATGDAVWDPKSGLEGRRVNVAALAAAADRHQRQGARQQQDIDADGRDDLIWHNRESGAVVGWLMGADGVRASAVLGHVPPEWRLTAVFDINGNRKADLLFRHAVTGALAAWLLDGLAVASTADLGHLPAEHQIAALGDLDGNGAAEILYLDRAAMVYGIRQISQNRLAQQREIGRLHPGLTFRGLADFDGDGRAELAWFDTRSYSGHLCLLRGTDLAACRSLPSVGAGWVMPPPADVDGDGRADLLWRNTTTHAVQTWLMNGLAVTRTAEFARGAPGWQVARINDYDGDGDDDLLWRNSRSGETTLWTIEGLRVVRSRRFVNVGVAWHVY